VLRFKLFDTPIHVQPFFWLIALFVGWTWAEEAGFFGFKWAEGSGGGVDMWLRVGLGAAIVLVGVLMHELGHAFAGRRFGLVPKIELHGLGGATSWEGRGYLTPARHMWVSFAGPLVGIVIGALALAVLFVLAPPKDSLITFTLGAVAVVNLGWGVLNLIPILPLDGGNIVASLFELIWGPGARVFVRWVSVGLSVMVIGLAVLSQSIFIGILGGFFALSNWRALRAERMLGADLALVLGEMREAQEALQRNDFGRASTVAEAAAKVATKPIVRAEALHLAALAALRSGDPGRARTLLQALPPEHPPDGALLGLLHFAEGEPARALEHLEGAVERGVISVVRELAETYAQLGRFDRAAEAFDKLTPAPPVEVLRAIERAAYDHGAFAAAAALGQTLFREGPSSAAAYNIACCLARADQPEAAIEWLQKAARLGLDRVEIVDEDADLAALRDRPDWPSVRASLARR
jgi:Zn-dependent protease